jgi:hypothetical protein
MRELSSSFMNMSEAENSNIMSGSRVRLLGVQWYVSNEGAQVAWLPALSNRIVELKDSSDNVLFSFAIGGHTRFGVSTMMPEVFMFGNASIVFPDGIHFTNMTPSANASEYQLVVFYEA